MKVLTTLNQQSQNRPIAFGVTKYGFGRPYNAFQNVIAADILEPKSNFSFLAFELIPDKKRNQKANDLQAVLDENNAFQIGLRQYRTPERAYEVYIHHKNILSDPRLQELLVRHWETIRKLFNSLSNLGSINIAKGSEKRNLQGLLLGDVYNCKEIKLDDGILKINQVARAMITALDQIVRKLRGVS